MWLFTQRGFFSIVAYRGDPDTLLVRARVKGDIEACWPQAKVLVTPGADYLYRAHIPKAVVGTKIGEMVTDIEYDNYKGHITDRRRSRWYAAVWDAMCEMQYTLDRTN